MDPFKVPSGEIEQRISSIQRELQESDINGLFVIQRVDLFYFSGTAQNGYLFIPAEGHPTLFIKKYLPRALEETSIQNTIGINSVTEVPGLIRNRYGKLPNRIGFEFDVLPVQEFRFYQRLFKDRKLVDGSPAIHTIRRIKSPWEIAQLEKTAGLSHRVFQYIREAIRPGLTEMELTGMYEAFARKYGHSGQLRIRNYLTEGYNWHLLSGESGGMVGLLDAPATGKGTSAAFPCGAGDKPLREHEPIMVDIGIMLNGYHIDETRMFAMGSMPDSALKTSKAAIEIHNTLIEKAKPGMTLGELFDLSLSQADEKGYADQYLGPPDYKVTFVGHGIGLELVEPPIIAKGRELPLQTGMVFALEPKMVCEGKFTAGVESVFTITETGAKLISQVPAEIFIS